MITLLLLVQEDSCWFAEECTLMESNLVRGNYTVTPGWQTFDQMSLVRYNHHVLHVCLVMPGLFARDLYAGPEPGEVKLIPAGRQDSW